MKNESFPEEVRHKDGVALMMTCCDDFNDVNNQNVVFDGRFPKYDNEVALAGKYAGEKDLYRNQKAQC